MNDDLKTKFQAIADEGIKFSVTLPEIAEVPAIPAIAAEIVEFFPSQV